MSDFIFLVGISEKYIGFSYCRVANDNNFDKVIVFFLFSSFCHY